jgi:hypothetical protein
MGPIRARGSAGVRLVAGLIGYARLLPGSALLGWPAATLASSRPFTWLGSWKQMPHQRISTMPKILFCTTMTPPWVALMSNFIVSPTAQENLYLIVNGQPSQVEVLQMAAPTPSCACRQWLARLQPKSTCADRAFICNQPAISIFTECFTHRTRTVQRLS